MIVEMLAPKGDVSTHDILVGAGVLAVLLPIFYVIGRTVSAVKNVWFTRKWRPLTAVLQSATITNNSMAVTSRLSGGYEGANVFALMTPKIRRYRYSDGDGNQFAVGISEVAGARDWSIRWSTGIPLISPAGWSVVSGDDAFSARLTSAGIVNMIESFGPATVRYQTYDRTLVWTAFITPLVALSPQEFKRLIEALMDVAVASRALNA